MIAKGNNWFQSYVKQEAETIENLLDFVPKKLEELRKEMEDSVKCIPSVEYEEWDPELEKNVERLWSPTVDTSIVDEMLDLFYATMVARIYSFAENGLRILSGSSSKPKFKGQRGQKQPSDLDLYYQAIMKKYEINLPQIENLWPNKNDVHNLRKQITHKGGSPLTEVVKHLSIDLDDVSKMLLFVEEKILENNPCYDSIV